VGKGKFLDTRNRTKPLPLGKVPKISEVYSTAAKFPILKDSIRSGDAAHWQNTCLAYTRPSIQILSTTKKETKHVKRFHNKNKNHSIELKLLLENSLYLYIMTFIKTYIY
jgi:hypothetical protein